MAALTSAFACEALMPSTPPVTVSGDLPKILFIGQLSALIGKTETTIRTCATNAKYEHLIPRPFKLPNSRRLCWYEHDVLAWINSTRPAEPPPPKRPRGRPTKVEQLARARWQELNASIQDRSQRTAPVEPPPPKPPQKRPQKIKQPAHASSHEQNTTDQRRAGGQK